MLYNYEKDLKSAEERIKSSGISEANKQLIFEFESNCFAEGLRISRTLHLTELKVFTEMFGKELKDASKLDILKMIERIERMDRSDRTKDDYKILIRKFFKWLGKSDIVDWMKMLFAIRTDQSLGCPFIILYYA